MGDRKKCFRGGVAKPCPLEHVFGVSYKKSTIFGRAYSSYIIDVLLDCVRATNMYDVGFVF